MLPKKYKLKKDIDFKRVFQQGKHRQRGFIRIKFSENNMEITRFGFVVGLKVSKKAVERNRIKRCLGKITQLRLKQIKPGFDIVVLVEPEIKEKKYQAIETNLVDLLKEVELVN